MYCSTAGSIDKSINRRRILWSKDPAPLFASYVQLTLAALSLKSPVKMQFTNRHLPTFSPVVSRRGGHFYLSLLKTAEIFGGCNPAAVAAFPCLFSNKVAILWEILSCYKEGTYGLCCGKFFKMYKVRKKSYLVGKIQRNILIEW